MTNTDLLHKANEARQKLIDAIDAGDTPHNVLMLALDAYDLFMELNKLYTAHKVLLLAVNDKLDWDDKALLSNTIAETCDLYDVRFYFDARAIRMRYDQQYADYLLIGENDED
jgi:hypothetical protein